MRTILSMWGAGDGALHSYEVGVLAPPPPRPTGVSSNGLLCLQTRGHGSLSLQTSRVQPLSQVRACVRCKQFPLVLQLLLQMEVRGCGDPALEAHVGEVLL